MTEPTDAELAALAVEINRTDWDDAMDALICFARAVLARWGQPAHSGEPVAWLDPWTGAKVTTDYDAYGKHGIPLYTAPQPVEREPLTEAQINAAGKKMAECMDYPWGYMPEQGRAEMRKHAQAVIEAAHGIKGDQHGTK